MRVFQRHVLKTSGPLIRTNITALAADPRVHITPEIRRKLVQTSRSTMERTLKKERKKRRGKGRSTTKPDSLLKRQISIKVFCPWDDQRVAFCEIDAISHDGGNVSGEFRFTLTVTDITTQWTEERALKNMSTAGSGKHG
ncbi:MAG: hypothetical protein LBK73_16205 [Treponema sp.]|nr:hypothetical protein [Treponema sp.]